MRSPFDFMQLAKQGPAAVVIPVLIPMYYSDFC